MAAGRRPLAVLLLCCLAMAAPANPAIIQPPEEDPASGGESPPRSGSEQFGIDTALMRQVSAQLATAHRQLMLDTDVFRLYQHDAPELELELELEPELEPESEPELEPEPESEISRGRGQLSSEAEQQLEVSPGIGQDWPGLDDNDDEEEDKEDDERVLPPETAVELYPEGQPSVMPDVAHVQLYLDEPSSSNINEVLLYPDKDPLPGTSILLYPDSSSSEPESYLSGSALSQFSDAAEHLATDEEAELGSDVADLFVVPFEITPLSGDAESTEEIETISSASAEWPAGYSADDTSASSEADNSWDNNAGSFKKIHATETEHKTGTKHASTSAPVNAEHDVEIQDVAFEKTAPDISEWPPSQRRQAQEAVASKEEYVVLSSTAAPPTAAPAAPLYGPTVPQWRPYWSASDASPYNHAWYSGRPAVAGRPPAWRRRQAGGDSPWPYGDRTAGTAVFSRGAYPAPWAGAGRPPTGAQWPWPALATASATRGYPAAVPSGGVYSLYSGSSMGQAGMRLASQWYRPAVVPLPGGARMLPSYSQYPRPAVAMATSELRPGGNAASLDADWPWPAVSMAHGGDALVVTGRGSSSGAMARAAGRHGWPPAAVATAGGSAQTGAFSRASSGGFNLVFHRDKFWTEPLHAAGQRHTAGLAEQAGWPDYGLGGYEAQESARLTHVPPPASLRAPPPDGAKPELWPHGRHLPRLVPVWQDAALIPDSWPHPLERHGPLEREGSGQDELETDETPLGAVWTEETLLGAVDDGDPPQMFEGNDADAAAAPATAEGGGQKQTELGPAAKKQSLEASAPAPAQESTTAPVQESAPATVQESAPAPVQEAAPAPVQESAPAPVQESAPAPVQESVPAAAEESGSAVSADSAEPNQSEPEEADGAGQRVDTSDGAEYGAPEQRAGAATASAPSDSQ